MFWDKHTLAVLGLLVWICGPVYAFTFSYGDAFSVRDLEHKNGVLKMPLQQKKYSNVKILAKPLYQFLLTCTEPCRYPVEQIDFVSTDYRRAFTNADLIIAEVEFNQTVSLTFLIFTQAGKISIKAPQEITFHDKILKKQVEDYLKNLVQNL